MQDQDVARLERSPATAAPAPATARRLGAIAEDNVFVRARASYLIDLDDGGSLVALNLGSRIPAEFDRVVIDLVAGEWTFRHDG